MGLGGIYAVKDVDRIPVAQPLKAATADGGDSAGVGLSVGFRGRLFEVMRRL
jgi:hypothetical protein